MGKSLEFKRCVECRKPFRKGKDQGTKSFVIQKFCSCQCYWRSNGWRPTKAGKHCVVCKNPILAPTRGTRGRNRKFCSKRCQGNYYKSPAKNCLNCGHKFQAPEHTTRRVYCSNNCKYEHAKSKRPFSCNCQICGNKFQAPAHNSFYCDGCRDEGLERRRVAANKRANDKYHNEGGKEKRKLQRPLQNQYQAKWRKQNPERCEEYKKKRRDYYWKNRAKCLETARRWKRANPTKLHEYEETKYAQLKELRLKQIANPEGEKQWLLKAKSQLNSIKSLLKKEAFLKASPSPTEESTPHNNSPRLCRHL